MIEYIKSAWDKVKTFFKHSTTLVYARLNVLLGLIIAGVQGVDWVSLYTAITSLDWSKLKASTISAAVLIFNGVVTEILRRRSLNA